MSNRVTNANGAADLADWIISMGGEDKALDFFASHVAGGESVPDFIQQQGLNWGVFAAWIRKNPDRNQRYKDALHDRGAIRREKVLDKWWEVAQLRPSEEAKHADVHKALEALAKTEGMFRENITVNATIKRNADELSDDELLSIATRRGDGTVEAQEVAPESASVH